MKDSYWDQFDDAPAKQEGNSYWDQFEDSSIGSAEKLLGDQAKGYFEDYIVDQAPQIGATIGGMVGGLSGSLPGGIAGASAGGFTGKSLENLYNQNFRPERAPNNNLDYVIDPVISGIESANDELIGNAAGSLIGNAGHHLNNATDWTLQKTGRVANNIPEKYTQEYIDRGGNIVARESNEIADELTGLFDDSQNKYFNAKDALNQSKLDFKDTEYKIKEGIKDQKYDLDNQLNYAKNEADTAYNSEVGNLKSKNLAGMRGEVEYAIHELKNKVSEGSKQAYEALNDDKSLYELYDAKKLIQSEIDKMGAPVSDSAINSVKNLTTLKERLNSIPGFIDGPQVKKILQQLDQDLEAHYSRNAGDFSPDAARVKSMVRSLLDKTIKESNPAYAEIMKVVADDSSLLNMASKMYGQEASALSRLSNIGSLRGREIDSQVLRNLGKKTGMDFDTPLDDFLKSQDTLKSPMALQSLRENIPAHGRLQQLESSKNMMKDPSFNRGIQDHPEILSAQNAISKSEQGLVEAENRFNVLKKVSPGNVQNKMKSLTGARDYAPTMAFQEIDELTGKNYSGEIKDRAILDSFQKGDTNGSRKTLLGGVLGGAPGAALGFVADKYAGPMFKKGLDAKIYGANQIDKILQNNPEFFGKFSGVLQQATQRGSTGLGATHFILEQTNPEYREQIKKLKEPNEE